ncbi:hypothetical protein OG21DRAFT_1486451 [Imleria badia]|nr:hypothetical protein OG21DRAFT_1486451 [Imleria badia]
MSGPGSGKYWIHLAEGPKPLIGIDEKFVITEGRDNVFTVNLLANGQYTLALGEEGERPLFINEDDGKLDRGFVPLLWSIRKQGGHYTIEVPSIISPTKGWTATSPEPKSLVTLKFVEIPLPDQLWNFVRWPGPE